MPCEGGKNLESELSVYVYIEVGHGSVGISLSNLRFVEPQVLTKHNANSICISHSI